MIIIIIIHKHQLLIFGLIQQTHLLLSSNNNDNVRMRPTINKTKQNNCTSHSVQKHLESVEAKEINDRPFTLTRRPFESTIHILWTDSSLLRPSSCMAMTSRSAMPMDAYRSRVNSWRRIIVIVLKR